MPAIERPQPKTREAISQQNLQRLLEISIRLSSTLHLDELLSLVMDVATELTDTETASILLVDRKTGQLHFVASTRGTVPTDTAVPLDNSIAGWVVRHGRSLVLSDVQTDTRFYSQIDTDLEFVTRSMLAVPLVTSQGTIGALEVLNKRNNVPYTSQDVTLMEALASQSAVAIVNAHLFHQSDLLAEIMHEIKTPIMAISAAAELLSRPDAPAEKHDDLVRMIKRESVRLSNMTRDFLDFARLESGRVRFSREPVDLGEIIQDVANLTQSQAAERGIRIETKLAPGLPTASRLPTVVGDRDRLKQVLLNLVSNAIKYNKENGRIGIDAQLMDDEVRVTVADTGRGIDPQDIDHLFERFYRVPGSEGVSEGSGLGLAVARKIVEEHNGRIEVESTLGEGTTFTVFLPLQPL